MTTAGHALIALNAAWGWFLMDWSLCSFDNKIEFSATKDSSMNF